MNLKAGGKQPRMRDGWFINADNERVIQKMCLPDGTPKGLKLVLQERGLFAENKRASCARMDDHVEDGSCCHQRLLAIQPDFADQQSLLHEIIQAAGYLCIFLPKFHCELNPIEFFWGASRRYARGNILYSDCQWR